MFGAFSHVGKSIKPIDWKSKVLGILRDQGEALSAYQVLEKLRIYNPKIAPPTVYRALAALCSKGLIHRLESKNAFIACQCDHHQQAPVLTICDDCGLVEESLSPKVLTALSDVAGRSGFALSHQVIELHGTCASCATEIA